MGLRAHRHFSWALVVAAACSTPELPSSPAFPVPRGPFAGSRVEPPAPRPPREVADLPCEELADRVVDPVAGRVSLKLGDEIALGHVLSCVPWARDVTLHFSNASDIGELVKLRALERLTMTFVTSSDGTCPSFPVAGSFLELRQLTLHGSCVLGEPALVELFPAVERVTLLHGKDTLFVADSTRIVQSKTLQPELARSLFALAVARFGAPRTVAALDPVDLRKLGTEALEDLVVAGDSLGTVQAAPRLARLKVLGETAHLDPLRSFPAVETLTLDGVPTEPEQRITARKLKTLTVRQTGAAILGLDGPVVEELTVRGELHARNLAGFPALRKLRVQGALVGSAPSVSLPQLKEIETQGSSLEALRTAPNLESLVVRGELEGQARPLRAKKIVVGPVSRLAFAEMLAGVEDATITVTAEADLTPLTRVRAPLRRLRLIGPNPVSEEPPDASVLQSLRVRRLEFVGCFRFPRARFAAKETRLEGANCTRTPKQP